MNKINSQSIIEKFLIEIGNAAEITLGIPGDYIELTCPEYIN